MGVSAKVFDPPKAHTKAEAVPFAKNEAIRRAALPPGAIFSYSQSSEKK